ncbi:porin [Flavisolibacter nicotianae]|uniref:porin n=1 Tax=Flavisolibacter nicotianae TaxID=2364882 RepID=UPI000EB0AC47|nr:porin [Flavisolibacter nicotianae]
MKKSFAIDVLTGLVWGIFPITAGAQDTTKPVTITAYAEVYYLYNFNRPLNNTQPFFLYSYHRVGEINLNLGWIKGSYSEDRVRANLALMTGTYAVANLAAEPEVLRHIFEADIGVKLSAKSNLWLDAGILPSHIGFESAVGKDCPTLTRSILAENSPYYEAGLKLGYTTKEEKWYLALLLLNGWQRIKRVDGNTTPAFGTQVTYKPSARSTLNWSTFIGNDKPDSARRWRYFQNIYGTFHISKAFSLIAGIDAGMEQQSKGSVKMDSWYAPVVIARYQLNEKVAATARSEFYSDKQGVVIPTRTANGFQTVGYSLNFDFSIKANLLWRIEARTLNSKDKIFEKRNRVLTTNSTWLATSIAVSF